MRRIVLGILAGGSLLIGTMVVLAGVAILCGWIPHDDTRPLDLGSWLLLEVVGGGIASVVAGWVCRKISRHAWGPYGLALTVLTIGLLEVAEILRHARAGALEAPLGLVLVAPFVAALGILLGGFRRSASPFKRSPGVPLLHRITDPWRYAVPGLVLVGAVLLSLFVVPGRPAGVETTVVASALTLDLTVGVPVLVYLFLVRTQRWPWIALVPTAVVGYVLATATLPEQHHTVLEVLRLLVIPAELALVTYLLVQAKKVFASAPDRSDDFVTRFRWTARQVLGSRIAADILTTEVGILYHAFHPGASRVQDHRAYTVHRETGYLSVLLGLLLVLLVETLALHLLVSQWSAIGAWVLTGLSVYALIWFVGDYRAFAARPVRLGASHVLVRVGLRWEVTLPLDAIAAIEVHPSLKDKPEEALSVVVLGRPTLRLTLRHAVQVIGVYGMRKTTDDIWLHVDEVDRFCNALQDPPPMS